MFITKEYLSKIKTAARETIQKYKNKEYEHGYMRTCSYCAQFYDYDVESCTTCPLDINGDNFGCIEQATYIAGKPTLTNKIEGRINFHKRLKKEIGSAENLEQVRALVKKIDKEEFKAMDLSKYERSVVLEELDCT